MRWTDEYLEKVASQIRVKRARGPLTEELREHMECQKEAYLAEGMAEAEAERRTVAGMGDALLVGGELDRAHRLRPQWRGIFIALLLIALLIRCALHFTRMENRTGAMIGTTATAELALQCALFYLSSFTGWSKEFCHCCCPMETLCC